MSKVKDLLAIKKVKIAIIILLTVTAMAGITCIWARYKTLITGSEDAEVARWYFKVTDENGQEYTDQRAVDFGVGSYPNRVVADKVAPGTEGEFEIVVDTQNTEVSLEYNVNIALQNCPKNMIFYRVTGTQADPVKTQISGKSDSNTRQININKYLTCDQAKTAVRRFKRPKKN